MQAGGNLLLLAGVQPVVKDELERTGLIDIVGRENVFEAQPGLGASLDAALAAAQAWLSTRETSQDGAATKE